MKFIFLTTLFFGFQLYTFGQVTESNSSDIKSNQSISSETVGTINSFSPPEFPDGDVGLFKYLNKKTKYPKKLKDSGINGMVYVAFQITETGEIPTDSIRVTKGVHPLLNEEAINVISKMPNWKPAIDQEGNPIKVWFELPVRFM